MSCRLCQTSLDGARDTAATGVCSDCRAKLGIVPLPPPRRCPTRCLHCNGLRFIRTVPRELSAEGYEQVDRTIAPMTATIVPPVSPRLIFKGNNVEEASVSHGVGVLELYICSACGRGEWYCQDPESIPIGPEFMTEIIDLSPSSPFRG